MTSRPVLLTGYDAKRCARRIHNEWDPAIPRAQEEVPPALQRLFDLGVAFEAAAFTEIMTGLDAAGSGPRARYTDLRPVKGKTAIIEATVSAMEDGLEVILGGWLPDDVPGARTGRPDILLRLGDGGYVPGDVKAHKSVAGRAKGELTYSLPAAPAERRTAVGYAARTTDRLDDYLQLAHYWRMLEAAGRASSSVPPAGFIFGTDTIDGLAPSPGGHLLTWVDLAAPVFETYSRSLGRRRRTALERYDHEQGFRRKVAETALSGGPALVQPVFIDECDSCPWHDYCLGVAGDDTASARITSGRLSVREWTALRSAGVVSVSDLAGLDPADPAFRRAYLPEVTHVRAPDERLSAAIRRARMIRDGIVLERETTGPVAVPRADVEIDFDVEWDPDDHVYLWGALVSRPDASSPPEYHAVAAWNELTGRDVARLAEDFADWLRGQAAAAEASGQTLLVYHYSSPEPTRLKRILGQDAVADLLARFVDLYPIIRENFFGVKGLGIKQVAPAFGFRWRDDDPGGLQSQLWLLAARSALDPARRHAGQQRILAYNEDDVRATAAVRAGLAALQSGDRTLTQESPRGSDGEERPDSDAL